jgi:hypothetical protein
MRLYFLLTEIIKLRIQISRDHAQLSYVLLFYLRRYGARGILRFLSYGANSTSRHADVRVGKSKGDD